MRISTIPHMMGVPWVDAETHAEAQQKREGRWYLLEESTSVQNVFETLASAGQLHNTRVVVWKRQADRSWSIDGQFVWC